MDKKFNQQEYINKYNKDNYCMFSARIRKNDKKRLERVLEKFNLSKPEFIRQSILKFEEKIKERK